jgi:hypothetical protein
MALRPAASGTLAGRPGVLGAAADQHLPARPPARAAVSTPGDQPLPRWVTHVDQDGPRGMSRSAVRQHGDLYEGRAIIKLHLFDLLYGESQGQKLVAQNDRRPSHRRSAATWHSFPPAIELLSAQLSPESSEYMAWEKCDCPARSWWSEPTSSRPVPRGRWAHSARPAVSVPIVILHSTINENGVRCDDPTAHV